MTLGCLHPGYYLAPTHFAAQNSTRRPCSGGRGVSVFGRGARRRAPRAARRCRGCRAGRGGYRSWGFLSPGRCETKRDRGESHSALSPVGPRRQVFTTRPVAYDTASLAVESSHGLGVKGIRTACAAYTFTHCTPPPFIARSIS